MQTVWIIVAGAVAVVVLAAIALRARELWPERRDPDVPATPLERLGWIGIAVTTTVGTGLAVLMAVGGITGFSDDGAGRALFTLLLLAGIGVWVASWRVLSRKTGSAVIDERDRDVLARSFSVESVIVILSLVTWTIALTEVFADEGTVPVEYLQLIFWTTFIAGAFGRSLGIVLGYRRKTAVDA
jgi:hypothetical protein